MKRHGHKLDSGAIPDISTINLTAGMNRIDRCESEVELTVVTYVIRSNFITANTNAAPAMAKLAA
jgi:hypothetical protein